MSTGTPTDTPDGSGDTGTPATEPRRFGTYLLLNELGRGAQGVVFLAEDPTLHRKVALKMLTGAGASSQITRDRFRREAELTSKFEHPGICGVRDFGEVDGIPYIAMQYVRGTTLAAIVEKSSTTTEGKDARNRTTETITIGGGNSKGGLEDVLRLIERAARALHVAHEAGLVHRDIKPANIMVTPDGHPVLLDFGLARDLEAEGQTLTQSGQIMGTPAYLAPEQIVAARGAVDRRTDVYALGVTLFECLTLTRPFQSTTWDQLFHEILDGATQNPRKINPRIPEELRTVIEVAMDRDPARRYPTAEALAEDLRRVRSFEPIQAKAAGPITRLSKWSRRHPGRASTAAAALVFVLVALTFIAARLVQRVQDLRGHLVKANEALVAADYVAAAVEVSRAQELDPDSAVVRELMARVERAREEAQRAIERSKALAGASEARDEAIALGARYAETRRKIEELAGSIEKERSDVLGKFVDDAVRAEFAGRESRLAVLSIEAERTLLSRSEALERARRLEAPWVGVSPETESALAGFYLERWHEAVAANDTARAEAMRSAVVSHDPRGEHSAELLGRGSLTLSVIPADATLHLFRFEPYETVRTGDVIPRLVPVPTSGVGRVRESAWVDDFHPGDPCLVVRAVEPGSIAEANGIAPGDLILRCAGRATSGWVCVHDVVPGSCLAQANVAPLAVVDALDGRPLHSSFEWELRVSRRDSSRPDATKQSPLPRVSIEGMPTPLDCDANEIRVADELQLIHAGAVVPMSLDCLSGTEMRRIDLPAGVRVGLHCERTAYPLIRAAANRIEAGELRAMDPGSYLIVASRTGCADQRLHLIVERGRAVTADIRLLPSGEVPRGFVHVPPGPFQQGGDAAAFKPREGRTMELEGFLIARRELTNSEWYEFVNDPATLAKIAAEPPGKHLYLPEDDRVMAKQKEDGTWVWNVYSADSAASPVLGLSWNDVRDYLVWRNARAEARGEAWRYDMPSEDQWEKAARGADGRIFSWGNRFDPSLTVCFVRQDVFLLDAPGGSEPRDESPYGLLDMGGSREEWLRDAVENSDKPFYRKRGGAWNASGETPFHCASRGYASPAYCAAAVGVRLIARRP